MNKLLFILIGITWLTGLFLIILTIIIGVKEHKKNKKQRQEGEK